MIDYSRVIFEKLKKTYDNRLSHNISVKT